MLTRYPFFSAYITAVLVESVALLLCRPATSQSYWVAYWVSELLTAALSFGIALDGYNEVLAPYPGVRRMARFLLGVLFAIVGAKLIAGSWGDPLHHLPSAIGEFERDLRLMLALSLLAFVGLVVHYAIPLRRNTLLLVIGYGFYLGLRLATVNFLPVERLASAARLSVLLQFAWNATAVIWIIGLWSRVPTWLPEIPIEIDYDRASQHTVRAFEELRHHVVDSWRSS
ncbi:MAG TPA: hypothetical protein VKV17_02385 [Bryobacteraceae bacterium]|nr:hypothetical protein [Bryobacteraceae bacterium]